MASAFSTHLLDLLVAQANRYTVANPDPTHVYLLYINDVVLGVYRSESSAVQVAHTIMGSPEFKHEEWRGGENNRWHCAAVARLAVLTYQVW